MKKLLSFFILFIISTSCNWKQDSVKPPPEEKSQLYSQIEEAIKKGELPKLDTSTDLRGKEVDGIREDVLREIEKRFKEKYQDKGNIYKSILLSAWVDQRLFEIDPTDREQAKHHAVLIDLGVDCNIDSYNEYIIPKIENKYKIPYPNFLDVKEPAAEYEEGFDEIIETGKTITALTYNTYERAKYYDQLNRSLDGTVSSSIPDEAHKRGLSTCQVLEKIKEYWKQGRDISSIDYMEIIDELSQK
ncbi:hypothetical protein [Thermovibrio sp.]